MEPVLFTYHSPLHDLDVVGRHVIREGLSRKLRDWQRLSGARELVYLATCQRVLWMFWEGDPSRVPVLDGAERFEGEAAWEHLLGLAAGLESANLGDREVTGQLRDALAEAREIGVSGEEAHAALEDVIREGQRLRARLGLADGSVSVATAALNHLQEALPGGASVAVVGVGPMSQYLAERLPERGFRVTLANRTALKAEVMADRLDLRTVSLGQLRRDPAGFDAIVTATSSPEPLFTLAAWAALPARPALRILDLALPPDSEAALGQLPWVHRMDLAAFLAETTTARAHRADAARKAAPILAGAAERLRRRAHDRWLRRGLESTRARLNEAWDSLEHETLGGALSGLDPDQREALEQLLRRGRTLAHRSLIQGECPDVHFEHATGPHAGILQLGAS
ncbi:MAG TPA: hypothetical protein VJ600_06750 [Holophagaceae bacterium]|nr:hypothetical protein [Holophagaceae bacterium]